MFDLETGMDVSNEVRLLRSLKVEDEAVGRIRRDVKDFIILKRWGLTYFYVQVLTVMLKLRLAVEN